MIGKRKTGRLLSHFACIHGENDCVLLYLAACLGVLINAVTWYSSVSLGIFVSLRSTLNVRM